MIRGTYGKPLKGEHPYGRGCSKSQGVFIFGPRGVQGVHFMAGSSGNTSSKMKLVLLLFYYYWGVMNCTDLLRSALCAHSGLNYVLSENGAETAKTCRNPAIRKGEFIW